MCEIPLPDNPDQFFDTVESVSKVGSTRTAWGDCWHEKLSLVRGSGAGLNIHRLAKSRHLWETVGMPKKQQKPQTHEDGEAQKLVDRIERKVSDQKLAAPDRNLMVVEWIGTVPAIGACTCCSRQFKVPLGSMSHLADAQESLRVQFVEHKCEREDASQAAARIVREATDDK